MKKNEPTMKRPGLQPGCKTFVSPIGEEFAVYPETVTDKAVRWMDILGEFQKLMEYGADSDLTDRLTISRIWSALIERAREDILINSELLRKECGIVAAYRVVGEVQAQVASRFIAADDPEMKDIIGYAQE